MNYSRNDIEKMKISAVKQAEEFRKLADSSENGTVPPKKNSSPLGGISAILGNLTSNLFEDDSLIILILILLLIKEGSDKEIILALVYILL